MKGKTISVFGKIFVAVLSLAVIISMSSCARKKRDMMSEYGQAFCDDPSLGQFDVYVIPVPGQPGSNQVSIIPVSLTANGDIMRITVANSALQYKPLLTEVALNVDVEIVAGYVSDNELQTYDKLVISPYEPGQPFLSENDPAKSAVCQLPLPGQVQQLN